ncbi:sulfate transporter CysZ [Vibrio sp. SM6]|uniref:Sulfate transporter CysZ n=1 Tax=Vibrio agarilyticus TaxID=2726741 RepID=A0A7X8TMR9_9VIBR|nr:sulfate transporter CysZ [Vibrio agarilyticus]NLS11613.1 sulfate transporter CysZ [Vibrio agarilyticus]
MKKRSGIGYFIYGAQLALSPTIRRFVLMPLLANILLVGSALWYLFSQLQGWIAHWIGELPSYLTWLSYVLWPLMVLTILATFSYFFSTLANLIAAPFNGLLAERVEYHLRDLPPPNDGIAELLKDLPRVFRREWRKLRYVLPKAIGLFILLLIPALGQTLAPLLWFAFTAWMLTVQYCDYPFDNHKVPFDTMRRTLKQNQIKSYSFGAVVSVFTTVPVLNLFVMPIAVCGATAMWVEEYQPQITPHSQTQTT